MGTTGTPGRQTGPIRRSARRLVVTAAILASLLLPAEALAWLPPEQGPERGCTVVDPAARATLEVTIPDSFEFCPLLARALSEDVLHRRVGIIDGHWHYPGAALSCALHRPPPRQARRITIRNSRRACRWLVASGWVATGLAKLRAAPAR
jgi:hypothetical protein